MWHLFFISRTLAQRNPAHLHSAVGRGRVEGDVSVVGRSGVRPVGTPVVGHARHRGHGVSRLRQVWLVDHHQAVAEVHRALVAGRVGYPVRLHGDQVLHLEADEAAEAGEREHHQVKSRPQSPSSSSGK